MLEGTLEALEKKKAALIARFLELQELADRTNDRIYSLTVEIEQLNARIKEARQAAPAR
jgi:chromosome segregation ATPase